MCVGIARGRQVVGALILLVVALVVGLARPVASVEPFPLTERVVDLSGALEDYRSEVLDAFLAVEEDHQVRMWVVFVGSFSGIDAQGWADKAFRATGLGERDYLLAVAMGDREYGYVVGEDFPLSDASLARVGSAASRLLAQSPGQAVLAATQEMDAMLSSRSGAGGRYPGWLVAVGLALIGAVVLSPLLFRDVRLGLGRLMSAAASTSQGSRAGGADNDNYWTSHGGSDFDWPDSGSSGTRGGSGTF